MNPSFANKKTEYGTELSKTVNQTLNVAKRYNTIRNFLKEKNLSSLSNERDTELRLKIIDVNQSMSPADKTTITTSALDQIHRRNDYIQHLFDWVDQ